jgi:hypothetical protein
MSSRATDAECGIGREDAVSGFISSDKGELL